MPTAPDFRDRLEALLGPVNTITRAAAALGCDRRSIYRWLDPDDPAPVPEWAIRHVETVEFFANGYHAMYTDPNPFLPECWQKPPPP